MKTFIELALGIACCVLAVAGALAVLGAILYEVITRQTPVTDEMLDTENETYQPPESMTEGEQRGEHLPLPKGGPSLSAQPRCSRPDV